MKKTSFLSLILLLLLMACAVVPGGRRGGLVVVPLLPPVVELDVEPYYFHGGFHYHYTNGSWLYATSRSGPWTDLPRDHYPKEVRYKNKGGGQGGGGRDKDDHDKGRGHDNRR